MPAKSLAEFVALAKAEPGKFNYASPGAATQTHLVIELLSRRAGIKLQHIPYRGGAPAMTAMVAGDTHFTAISTLLSLPQIQAGRLAADCDRQSHARAAVPGSADRRGAGLSRIRGDPVDRTADHRRHAERDHRAHQCRVNRALRDPDLIAKFAQQGIVPAGGTPDDFARTIATDIRNWTETARAANIKAE